MNIVVILQHFVQLSLSVVEIGFRLDTVGHDGALVVDFGSQEFPWNLSEEFLLIVGEYLHLHKINLALNMV